jgi:hypothetical protein
LNFSSERTCTNVCIAPSMTELPCLKRIFCIVPWYGVSKPMVTLSYVVLGLHTQQFHVHQSWRNKYLADCSCVPYHTKT